MAASGEMEEIRMGGDEVTERHWQRSYEEHAATVHFGEGRGGWAALWDEGSQWTW